MYTLYRRVHGICTLEYPESFNGYSLVSEHIMVQIATYSGWLYIYNLDSPTSFLLFESLFDIVLVFVQNLDV